TIDKSFQRQVKFSCPVYLRHQCMYRIRGLKHTECVQPEQEMRHGRISRNDKRRALLRADTRLSLQLLNGEADSLHCRHPDLLKPLRLILRIENPRQDILPKPDL